jgi:hypothetical protein
MVARRDGTGGTRNAHMVWHSITQMYWDAEELAAVEAILQRAGAQQLLGEVGLEFDLNDPQGAEPSCAPDYGTAMRHPASALAGYRLTITAFPSGLRGAEERFTLSQWVLRHRPRAPRAARRREPISVAFRGPAAPPNQEIVLQE